MPPPTPARRGGKLRLFAGSTHAQMVLAVVPGINTPSPENWSDSNKKSWLRTIVDQSPSDRALYAFDYILPPALETFSWQGLLDLGDDLLTCLLELAEDHNGSYPIVIVGHSLGGLIVKEALCLAHQRSLDLRSLLRALASVILLGVPHSLSENARCWTNAASMLKPNASPKNQILISKEDSLNLSNSSRRFEQASVSTPILSIFETRETKRRTNLIFSTKLILVEKESVQTNAKNERLLALDSDHVDLCNVDTTSRHFQEIRSFIEINLEGARSRLVEGSPRWEAPSALDDLTVRSPSRIGAESFKQRFSEFPALSPLDSSLATPDTTRQATQGSALSAEMVSMVSDFSLARREPRLPCYIHPSRNPDFYGRSDILQLLDMTFLQVSENHDTQMIGGTQLRSLAICGPGGIGKTQIAAEYVHSRKEHFDAIFWVYADQPSKIAEGFSRIAIEMGLIPEDSSDTKDQTVTRDIVKGWFANPLKTYDEVDTDAQKTAKWLLVLDNVDDAEMLTDYWPLDGPGCVLATSRDPLTKKSRFLATDGVDLGPFSREEAADLLLRLTERDADTERVDPQLYDVAERLGGYPLAITQMAGVITRRDLSFADFLLAYDEEDSREELFNLSLDAPGYRGGYQHNVATVWAIEGLENGRTLLDVLSFLDPDNIPERILTTKPGNAALEGFPTTAMAYQKARSELLQSSLVTRDKNTNKLTIHRLIQDTARGKMSNARFKAIFAATVRLLASIWPYDTSNWRHSVARWIVCEELFPHIVRIKSSASRFISSGKEHEGSLEPESSLELARLLTDAGWYHLERGNPEDSEDFYEISKVVCNMLKSEETKSAIQTQPAGASLHSRINDRLAEIFHHGGCAATVTNKPSVALSCFETYNSLVSDEFAIKPSGVGTRLAISWNELGVAHMMNLQWEKGEECCQKAIDIMREENLPQMMWSFPRVNLGQAYWLMGKIEKSLSVLLEGLSVREAAYGLDDRESFITGRFLHALGNVKATQGDLDESFAYHQRALLQYRSTVGDNHHRTAAACYKVAEHFARLNQNEAALKLLNQALKVYGARTAYRPERARAHYKSSQVLFSMGKASEGKASLEVSHQLYTEMVPDGTQSTGELGEAVLDKLVVFWSR